MTIRDEVLLALNAAMPRLRAAGVRELWLFGSVVRGEAREDSDIDIIVEPSSRVSLLELARIKRLLEEILGRRVDVTTRDSLIPALRDQILSEAVRAA